MESKIVDGLYYSKEHEWMKMDSDTATIGLTDFAQKQLGDITYIEPIEDDFEAEQFEPLTEIESVKAASEIYSPISGTVIAFNDELENSPQMMNQSPYEDGWIAKIAVSNPDEKANLMDAAAYRDYLKGLEE